MLLAQELAAIHKTEQIIGKFHACIESYLTKKETLSNATYLAMLRATEKEIIAAQGLEESRALHNRTRQLLLETV